MSFTGGYAYPTGDPKGRFSLRKHEQITEIESLDGGKASLRKNEKPST